MEDQCELVLSPLLPAACYTGRKCQRGKLIHIQRWITAVSYCACSCDGDSVLMLWRFKWSQSSSKNEKSLNLSICPSIFSTSILTSYLVGVFLRTQWSVKWEVVWMSYKQQYQDQKGLPRYPLRSLMSLPGRLMPPLGGKQGAVSCI